MEGILGKKLGMTQIYQTDGKAVPVTVVQAGPCLVVQRKTEASDGYEAVQLGLVEKHTPRRVGKALKGHYDKAGVAPGYRLVEFEVGADEALAAGDQVKATIFAVDDYVDVVGTSKGKGFQGVVKRHHFRGGAATHGSMFHRAPGSIGASAYPSRVLKGMRAGGHMGFNRTTAQNIEIVRVDAARNLLLIRGSVPGHNNCFLLVKKGKKALKKAAKAGKKA